MQSNRRYDQEADMGSLPNGGAIPLEPISVSGLTQTPPNPEHYIYNTNASETKEDDPPKSTLYDLDTLTVFARMLGLMLFVFTLNISAMPKVPYPFIGNLQDCDPDVTPEVWIEGSVIIAVMYGIISVRKVIVLIVKYLLHQVHTVPLTSHAEDTRGFVNNALDHNDGTDTNRNKTESSGVDIQEAVIFKRFQDPRNVPKPPEPPKARLRERGSQFLSNIRRALVGHADLGPTPSNRTSTLSSVTSGDSVSIHLHSSRNTPHIKSPLGAYLDPSIVPPPDQAAGTVRTKYTYRIYSEEEDSFRYDDKYCQKYVFPCLIYHLGFSVWLGWACNPYLAYFTSDLEFLVVGILLFLLGEGMSIIYSVVILRGSAIDNRVLLREGGEVLGLAGLALYCLTLPACTMALVRTILALAGSLKVIDTRAF